MYDDATHLDISPDPENMEPDDIGTVIHLDHFADGDYITKTGMTDLFQCSERTIQRMVERFEIPPPTTAAGRKIWRVGKLRAWLAQADDRTEAEALKEAKRMRVF